ncbi:MAG: PEGA domain-containing protein [Sandaracinaceae bacterium]
MVWPSNLSDASFVIRLACVAAILAVASLGWAPPARAQVGVTAIVIRDLGASRAQSTIAGTGIRRGVQRVEGLEFHHPVDELDVADANEDLEFALASLDPLADQMRTGDTHDAAARADEVVEVLESNLSQVQRTQLVDAYMIGAVARCLLRQQRECERRIMQVLTFREGLEYDAERYGEESHDSFDRARARAQNGPRGDLIVATEPAGAEVFVDGRSYGPSPARVPGLLVGWHYVTIKELGFERLFARAEVVRNDERTVSYELSSGDRSELLNDRALERLRSEVGEARAGSAIQGLRGTIPAATQVIIAVVRPAAAGALHVQLYLYHLATRNLQAQDELTVSGDEAGMATLEERTAALFEGVDLSGGLEAPDDDPIPTGPQPELYEQWWFWVAVLGGAALVAAGIGIGFALEGQSRLPSNEFIRIGGSL